MTRLFNLESYVECCQYAHLFEQSPEDLIPSDGDRFPLRAFLQKYAHHPYLKEPILHVLPPFLRGARGDLPYSSSRHPKLVGLALPTPVNQEENQRLFIISDTLDLMTLSMSNLLEYRDRYLYRSAYHYWNHFSEISQRQLTKPLVFVDLDSFAISRLIPIEPDRHNIPILNTRSSILLEKVYNSAEIYNSICREAASRILQHSFPDLPKSDETITHLCKYLQRISFFQIIQPYIQQQDLTFIVEILWQGKIFYKQVTLPVATILHVVSSQINAEHLNQLASKHPEYQFILISQYNVLSIQHLLPHYICLPTTVQDFSRIWVERNQQNLPLFAIYLDLIEFAIAISGDRQWLQLSSQKDAISYEGKPLVLIGRIPDDTNRDYFRIRQGMKTANLPIQVNGKDYCKNDVPQDYSIEIKNYQGTEDVSVRIEFHLQPGSFPSLKVTDLDGKYKITTSLRDRKTSGYIPIARINSTRKQKSSEQIASLTSDRLKQLQSALSELSEELKNFSRNYERLNDFLKNAYDQLDRNPIDTLQWVDNSANKILQAAFQPILNLIPEIVSDLLNSSLLTIDRQKSLLSAIDRQKLLLSAIKVTGKTYKFSQYLSVAKLFSRPLIDKANEMKGSIYGDPRIEYLQCLARVAVTKELQRQYFELFNSYHTKEKYMWGYGRILFWYYDFDAPTQLLDYQQHFPTILNYLLNENNLNPSYLQNAFFSLLYLLTFRAKNRTFCQPGSDEMAKAERVVEHFKARPIRFNQVSRETSLNQLFQDMIEGTTTEDDINGLLRAD